MRQSVFTVIALLFTANLYSGPVETAEELSKAVSKAAPGDEIVIKDGTWKDVTIRIVGNGAKDKPIRIRPETPGGLQVTGVSRIRIGGSWLELSGLRIHNIHGVSDCLQFRKDSKLSASNCRVTNCTFTEDADFDSSKMESRWIGIYGERNSLDHCRIEGKKNRGVTLAVWLQEGILAKHHIHNNIFGHRPPLGRNGGETIRIGDSKSCHLDAACLVEHNLFEKCNGEAECISNKSCENIYRENVFRAVEGTLSLRHGHRCLVEKNVFLGGGIKHTGGIRIIGQDHVVRDNHLSDLGGTNARGALVLQNGIKDGPVYGYEPVVRATVENNKVINCRECLVIGYADKDSKKSVVPPKDCIIRGNVFSPAPGREAIVTHNEAVGTTWKDNTAGTDKSYQPPEMPFLKAVGPSMPE